MQYGFVLELGDVPTILELTEAAESAGWDGIFIADGIGIETKDFPAFPWYDPWVVLGVMAERTERIRIGTMITAVPRRRPWKLARETTTVDHLSNGRLILGVGVGAAADDGGFYKVGEAMELKVRAQRLDEGLAILNGLWSSKPFTFHGEHYHVEEMTMLPPPVQSPRIPVWVVGVWPKEKSLLRALRWDGIVPQKYRSMEPMTAANIEALKQFVEQHRTATGPFDIIAGGQTPGNNQKRAAKIVRPYAEAGATWWLESSTFSPLDKLRARLNQGPPRLE
jgi:alkanesulfonate monooxygenase SsuD/methylene tetrahydromethanopterin reductase-like flavin-dependent oxidoreductase (luciferase family)